MVGQRGRPPLGGSSCPCRTLDHSRENIAKLQGSCHSTAGTSQADPGHLGQVGLFQGVNFRNEPAESSFKALRACG